jgi:hypothetical protein
MATDIIFLQSTPTELFYYNQIDEILAHGMLGLGLGHAFKK